MHPELFELKALVAGRLDAHRRREIDDHLGSCADCSRHYVAMMLGSASPKTAEAEAREALVPTGAGAVFTLIAGGGSAAPAYGIDAPIAPPAAPRPAALRAPHNNMVALETEFSAPSPRTPVSASLVDAISRLRADAVAPALSVVPVVEVVEAPVAVMAPAPLAASPERVAQALAPPLIAPSIFTPTPIDGVSLILPPVTPVATRAQPAPELVVTFSSTPPRVPSVRATATVAPIRPVAATVVTPSQEYVSQAVPTMASAPASAFELTTPLASPHTSKRPVLLGGVIAAAAVLLVVTLAGYKFFRSSVSDAASAAAAAATQQVEASARTRTPSAAPAAGPVQTRIVYVDKPSSRRSEPVQTKPETVMVAPSVPIAVTLPDVNLNTGADPVAQSSTQRNATSELTRSARATAGRTAAPRP